MSAVDEDGFCLGEKRVREKSNEITAIPTLLDKIALEGSIVSIDAMGCQYEIADKIVKKKADYLFSLKGNQGTLHEDVKEKRAVSRLVLQIHDELIVEAPEGEEERAAKILKREMEGAAQLVVPITAEAHWGKTWEAAKA